MHTLKIRAVGKDTGAVFPKRMLAELGVKEGDTVYATPAPDGSVRLTAQDPAFARQMALAEEVMKEDATILGALAARACARPGSGPGSEPGPAPASAPG